MPLFSFGFSLITRVGSLMFGLLGIGFLIGFHELGHFLFCKLFGVKTPSFSIGFGPKIFERKIGDTNFILSAFPLGGFVEIAGAAEVGQGEQKDAHAQDKSSFAIKPYYQKLLIMLGGIIFNLAFAYFAFFLLYLTGVPKTPIMYPTNGTTKIECIDPGSPAESIGLEVGDVITTINGISVKNNTITLIETTRNLADKRANIEVLRNGQPITYRVTVGSKESNGQLVGVLGIECGMKELAPFSFIESIKQSIATTNQWIVRTFMAFALLFKGGKTENLGGPIAVVSMTMKSAQAGAKIFLLLLAIISVNLAVLNLIPLPILDGGQILFYTIEAIIRRPLPLKVREYIYIGSWLLMLGLIILLSIRDVGRMASPLIESIKELFSGPK